MPIQYILGIFATAPVVLYPIRYKYSENMELQKKSRGEELRGQAIIFYAELERMYRRQAMQNHPIMQNDPIESRLTAVNMAGGVKYGNPTADESYFHAHYRDMVRTQELLKEIADLKAKIAVEAQKATN